MAELKTQKTAASVKAYLAAVEPPQRRADAQVVIGDGFDVHGRHRCRRVPHKVGGEFRRRPGRYPADLQHRAVNLVEIS